MALKHIQKTLWKSVNITLFYGIVQIGFVALGRCNDMAIIHVQHCVQHTNCWCISVDSFLRLCMALRRWRTAVNDYTWEPCKYFIILFLDRSTRGFTLFSREREVSLEIVGFCENDWRQKNDWCRNASQRIENREKMRTKCKTTWQLHWRAGPASEISHLSIIRYCSIRRGMDHCRRGCTVYVTRATDWHYWWDFFDLMPCCPASVVRSCGSLFAMG